MKKNILSLAFVAISAMAFSQEGKVGINTQTPKETLEVNGTVKVVDLPTDGANKIYNGGTSKTASYKATRQVVADADGVLGTKELGANWFYMPSIVLPLQSTDVYTHPYSVEVSYNASIGTYTVDLYSIYQKQFDPVTSISTTIATDKLPLYSKENLDFYVIYYDEKVFEDVKFTTDKKLSYRVKTNAEVTEHTFMNIVFRVK